MTVFMSVRRLYWWGIEVLGRTWRRSSELGCWPTNHDPALLSEPHMEDASVSRGPGPIASFHIVGSCMENPRRCEAILSWRLRWIRFLKLGRDRRHLASGYPRALGKQIACDFWCTYAAQ